MSTAKMKLKLLMIASFVLGVSLLSGSKNVYAVEPEVQTVESYPMK